MSHNFPVCKLITTVHASTRGNRYNCALTTLCSNYFWSNINSLVSEIENWYANQAGDITNERNCCILWQNTTAILSHNGKS